MKACIYLRTSTKEQDPELQKKECLEYANNKGHGIMSRMYMSVKKYFRRKIK